MRMFLGVDGGGTKTALCLLDEEGRIAAQAEAPGCYYYSGGIDLVGRVLQEGVDEVCQEAGITPAGIDHAFFGLPGYGEVSDDVPALDAAPGGALGHSRYACGNDTICGWAGSLGGADGINVVSGTGSITYGERDGRGVRVGGWGEVFGDEGSAYWISVRGLGAYSQMSDGRIPVGPLYGMLKERLDLENDLDLVGLVLDRWKGGRSEIAGLSRTIVAAASAGDGHAARIVTEAAGELAQMVDVTRRRLEFGPDETVPVSYSGGVFNADSIQEAFDEALAGLYDGYELRKPLYTPVVGAAIYAAKLAETPIDGGALRRLRASQRESRLD
jgi:N-acetylglucosamine kinase-like BadF-type ATPase